MKVLILGDAYEPHIIKWVSALVREDVEIILFSFNPGDPSVFPSDERITFYHCGYSEKLITGRPGNLSKLTYLRALPKLKRVIGKHNPDILHAHYAAGYGLIGALAGFQPFVLSAWGSDVVHFPTISPLHRKMIRFVLKRAGRVLCTSGFMAGHIEKLAGVRAEITPFGIDTRIFSPMNQSANHSPHYPTQHSYIVIGTIKKMKPEYNLHTLIWAFYHLRRMLPEQPLRLLMVGDGTERRRLEELTHKIGLDPFVHFTGYIPYSEVAAYHNKLDIYVNVSLAESFGVSVLEASACQRPVVASSVGGLREVVRHGHTGYLVEPGNSEAAAKAVSRLVKDPALRKHMGAQGREWVKQNYSLSSSVQQMLSVYNQVMSGK